MRIIVYKNHTRGSSLAVFVEWNSSYGISCLLSQFNFIISVCHICYDMDLENSFGRIIAILFDSVTAIDSPVVIPAIGERSKRIHVFVIENPNSSFPLREGSSSDKRRAYS